MCSRIEVPLSEPIADLLDAGFRYAMSLVHDRAAADDLVQDAWAAILRVNGPRDRRYLFRAIRNRWIDGWRHDTVIRLEALDAADPVPSGAPGPDASVDRAALDRALSALHPEIREALFLCVVEGWTAEEVGEHLGRPRGTVLSWVHRARAQLRAALSPAAREGVG